MAWYPNQYGQGMPGYSGYVGPVSYGYSGAMQQPQTNVPQGQSGGMAAGGIIWVDGEVGAKAYQMPVGWPAGTPIALWDTNDRVIYWKSINQMGMPNPLVKIPYHIEDINQPMLMSGTSESSNNYATKDDVQDMRNEIAGLRELLTTRNNRQQIQNGSQSARQEGNNGLSNRGGNSNG